MASTSPDVRPRTADLLYDAFYAGAVGGSIVAMYFLVVDTLNGEPFYTPSLMGSVMFLGADASQHVPVRLDLVAVLAVLHFAAFALVGFATAEVEQRLRLHRKGPVTAVLSVFLLNAIFFGAVALFAPGVVAAVGVGHILVANLLAATGMMLAVAWGHRRSASRAAVRRERRPAFSSKY